ncbi:MAG: AmmeMemoRadiSam system radical SAM enzyme [Candidatus Riflebacteria bacterium]|nr:AmmeMemoRadiSam system radical SAM enzyme [Candidatus Riflebacteria bacterium]
MNRRQFLLDLCTIAGAAGIAGLLAEPDLSPNPSARPSPRSAAPDRFDPAEGRRGLLALEQKGFTPREAMFWEKAGGGKVRCLLCPKFCVLRPYERGNCRVRVGLENRLATLVYGRPCSVAVDPIEKKPVFHYLPGSTAFSFATAGCLLSCRYCQNWQISQADPETLDAHDLPPDQVVAAAAREGCRSIAYTYTEPTIFYEYMYDTARLARASGIGNVVVSCGYINPEPLAQLATVLDVMKVDLKGFTERFYRTVCGGTLAPVLATLEGLARTRVLIDVVTLVVPTLNDDEPTMLAMFRWLHERLGPDISLFLSRFHPTFRLRNLPPTPPETLERLRDLAMATGLRYVYLGNVPGHAGESTFCPSCHKVVVGRVGYQLTERNLRDGCCAFCGTRIPGVWE